MLNNLEIRKYLYIVLFLLAATVGPIIAGIDIPVLRQLFGFVFLTIVPGTLILRILKVHNIGMAESLVYSVGLSLAFVMFFGLFVNILHFVAGISRPISLYPLTISFGIAVLIMSVVAYLRDKDTLLPEPAHPIQIFTAPNLFIILLPLLAISGALLVSYYKSNILLLLFIALTALAACLVSFNKFFPKRTYPFLILMIAVALLYHTTATLASSYLTGYDIQAEYLYQGITINRGYWSTSIGTNLNTALSLTLLSPIYSIVLGMDGLWVFKIIFPLFFCLVPLALFLAYREQAGDKRAFLSVFFFMSVIYFLGVSNRIIVAELFFAILILLIVEKRLTQPQKSVLALVCIFGLPISHYGLTYVCLFLLVIGYPISLFLKSKIVWRVKGKFPAIFSRSPVFPESDANNRGQSSVRSVLSGNFIILFMVAALGYYIYTAHGAVVVALLQIITHISGNLGELLNPATQESLVGVATGADFASVSISGRGFRLFQYATQIFIVIGFIRLFTKPDGLRFRTEYVALMIVCALILLLCIILPYFSSHMEVERFYHFTLFLLSPMCIIGGETVWQIFPRLFRNLVTWKKSGRLLMPLDFNHPNRNYIILIALLLLIPYFLFNTGFFFEVIRSEAYNVVDTPSSRALSSYRVDMEVSNNYENAVVQWLPDVVDKNLFINSDQYGKLSLLFSLYQQAKALPADVKEVPKDEYIFLRTWNLEKSELIFLIRNGEKVTFKHVGLSDLPELSEQIASKNLIYNNRGAKVLAP